MRGRGLGVGLWAAAAVVSALTIRREIGPHDEGLMLQAAQRVADGQWPYRDFWLNYGPGQPLLLGALVKALGPSLLWWRVLRVALDATVALLVFGVAREHGASRPYALGAWAAAAGAMAFPTGPGPNPAALALVLGGLLLAARRPLAAGALCGVAAVFRPEIGFAGALSVALAGGGVRALAAAAGVAVAGYVPFLVAGPGDLLRDTVGFLGVQGQQRLVLVAQWPGADPNKVLEAYVPLVALAGAALWAVRRRELWLAPLVAVGVLYLLGRADAFHLVPLTVVVALALALAAGREPSRAWRAALVAPLVLIAVHGLERRAGQLVHPPALAALPSPVADGVRATPSEARDLGALLARLPPGPILVAPPSFARVTVGDPLLYVLAQRPNPTRYDVMQPGVVTTARVQREMVADLRRARPRALVRWLDPRATRREANASGRERGATLLDAFLARAYGRPRRFGAFAMSLRSGP